jgi:hypothetical protein
MRILSDGTTIEISNEDLEPRTKWWRLWEYSRLKQEVVDALQPREQENADTQLLSILRVKRGMRRFQLPEDSVLLALEGHGKVMVPGCCAIWYCEAIRLKADVAVLGAGEVERLNCDVVSLQSQEEVREFLEGIWEQGLGRLRVRAGRIEYLLHARQDPDDGPYQLGAEIEGSGIVRRLRISNVDQAVSGYGNVSARYAVGLNESVRNLIHESLWENVSAKHSERIDGLLAERGIVKRAVKDAAGEQGRVHAIQRDVESRGMTRPEVRQEATILATADVGSSPTQSALREGNEGLAANRERQLASGNQLSLRH